MARFKKIILFSLPLFAFFVALLITLRNGPGTWGIAGLDIGSGEESKGDLEIVSEEEIVLGSEETMGGGHGYRAVAYFVNVCGLFHSFSDALWGVGVL